MLLTLVLESWMVFMNSQRNYAGWQHKMLTKTIVMSSSWSQSQESPGSPVSGLDLMILDNPTESVGV